jgi:hypothetical protein
VTSVAQPPAAGDTVLGAPTLSVCLLLLSEGLKGPSTTSLPPRIGICSLAVLNKAASSSASHTIDSVFCRPPAYTLMPFELVIFSDRFQSRLQSRRSQPRHCMPQRARWHVLQRPRPLFEDALLGNGSGAHCILSMDISMLVCALLLFARGCPRPCTACPPSTRWPPRSSTRLRIPLILYSHILRSMSATRSRCSGCTSC